MTRGSTATTPCCAFIPVEVVSSSPGSSAEYPVASMVMNPPVRFPGCVSGGLSSSIFDLTFSDSSTTTCWLSPAFERRSWRADLSLSILCCLLLSSLAIASISLFRCLSSCLLYTSDAADDLLCVDLGGRRIIQKKKYQEPAIDLWR